MIPINRSHLEKHREYIRQALAKFDSVTATFQRPIDFEWERYFDGFDVLILEHSGKSVKVEFTKNETYTE